jgi:hypothetical protein
VTTLTPDQLAQLLRSWAIGDQASEAAVQLLCEHRRWLERSDFVCVCVDVCRDGASPMGSVRWWRVPAFVRDAPCSSSEARVLRLAAELAGIDTGVPLAELMANLDDRNCRTVARAIARALRLGPRR